VEFSITLGIGGWALLIVASLLFGVVAQMIGDVETGFEWLVDGVAFFIGALVASEFVVAWSTIEPVWDGLALLPALIGGLVVGLVVEFATRRVTGGTYSGGHLPA